MFYYDGSQFDIGVAALLLKRTVWGEVLCMNWRLGVMVVLKNDEHERIKVDGTVCLELYGVGRSIYAWEHSAAFGLQTIGLGVGTIMARARSSLV